MPWHDFFPVFLDGLLLEVIPALALLGELRLARNLTTHLIAELILTVATLAFFIFFFVVVASGILLVLGLLLILVVIALNELHPGALLEPAVEILANLLQDQVPLQRLLTLQVNHADHVEVRL